MMKKMCLLAFAALIFTNSQIIQTNIHNLVEGNGNVVSGTGNIVVGGDASPAEQAIF